VGALSARVSTTSTMEMSTMEIRPGTDVDPTEDPGMTNENAGYMVAGG
jgi:hypothetical protein